MGQGKGRGGGGAAGPAGAWGECGEEADGQPVGPVRGRAGENHVRAQETNGQTREQVCVPKMSYNVNKVKK